MSKGSGVPESVRSLIQKVHALATQGVGGEAVSAQRKLNLLLEKHGITLDDIVQDQPKTYEFKFNGLYDEKLLYQCYVSIEPQEKGIYDFTRRGRKCRNLVGMKLTPSEYIDFCGLLDYYRKAFAKEMERFYTAFVHKHDLFSTEGREGGNSAKVDPQEVMRMMQMMGALREKSYQKPAMQIENEGANNGR